jgi:hypothetical protein
MMKSSKDYVSNMFGQYTPARYMTSTLNGDKPKRNKNKSNGPTKSADAVSSESCGRGSASCGAYKSGGTNKAKSTTSKTAMESKRSRQNFAKPKHNLKGRIVTKGKS